MTSCAMWRGFCRRSMVTDWDRVALAFDVLENAEVMEEFDDCLWIRVNREDWEALKESAA
jgi:hypothetical protein